LGVDEIPPRRIDKGVKRGPRQKGRPFHTQELSPRRKNGQIAEKLSNDPKLIEQAMREYSAGATLEELAKKHHVTRQAIYGWLLGDLGGEQHASLVTQALTSRIADADEQLETASLPLDVQRGRERARFSRMDYERRRPHLYGIRQEITVDHRVTVDHELSESATELLNKIRGLPAPVRRTNVMLNPPPIEQEGGVSPSLENDPPPLESGPPSSPLTESK